MDLSRLDGLSDLLLPNAAADAPSGPYSRQHQLCLGHARHRSPGHPAALYLARLADDRHAVIRVHPDTFHSQPHHAERFRQRAALMLAPAATSSRFVVPRFAFAFTWRELRGGLRGFGVFIACIALGVMAIAGVGSVAASLSDGLSGAGRVILGGDLAFSLIQREATDGERAFLNEHGAVSV